MSKIIICFSFIILVACKESKENKLATNIDNTNTDSLKLDNFKLYDWPKNAIEGCSCLGYIEGDSTYIYVDDYQKSAYIKSNGVFEHLKIQSEKRTQDSLIKKCVAEHFSLKLKLKKTDHIDELRTYQGLLEINNIAGQKMKYTVKMECGC